MSPELKMNLLLWDCVNKADNAINSAKRTLEKINRRKVDIKTSLYGRRKDDNSK